MMSFFGSQSSVGKKAWMAITGLLLTLFVIGHLLGNLQIFLGAEALNIYAEKLKKMLPLLWGARIFLTFILSAHIAIAGILTLENQKARPKKYALSETMVASYASRTLMASGVIIFLFILFHLLHFTWGVVQPANYRLADIKGHHDVYGMTVLGFQNIQIAGVYVLAMAVLCFHLSHGLASFPQSLGVDVIRHKNFIKTMAIFVPLFIFIGNTAIVLACFFKFLKVS